MIFGRRRQNPVHNLDPLLREPERATLVRLLLYMGLVTAPHLYLANPLFAGIFFVLWLFRFITLYQPRLLPRGMLLVLLTGLAVAFVIVRGGSSLGSETGISMLLIMSGLKLLEIKRRRDLYFSVLLGFFIGITVFLFENSMLIAIIVFSACLGLISILLEISWIQRPSHGLLPLRHSLWLALPAIPIALMLFFLFPRLGGPLWSLNLGSGTVAQTGLSDLVRPGSVSNLAKSYEVAFRATFEGPLPSKPERYWRGPVMWYTDGISWTRSPLPHMMQPRDTAPDSRLPLYHYRVFQEPSNSFWLLLLEHPMFLQAPDAWISRDGQAITRQPVSQAISYEAASAPQILPRPLNGLERREGLQLPPHISPQVRALAQDWRTRARSDQEIVQTALRYFREQPFIYSLQPPLLGDDPTHEFLFETRSGFCEHYATSFVLLMRLAGIPSRLVTGYLGGEENPQGNYLIVRQSDAHAWAEVWLSGRGWVRIDPTAAIAPERIEHPLDIEALTGEGRAALFHLDNSAFMQSMARRLRLQLDALRLAWQRWIINYDEQRQKNLFDLFGIGNWLPHRIGILALFLILGGLALIGLWFFRKERQRRDPVLTAYRLFLARLHKVGIEHQPHEGPLDFQHRLARERPGLAVQTAPITSAYIALRFGLKDDNYRGFVQRCQAFRPDKKP